MKRLLLYVHFNKYNQFSEHVYYQLERMRPLFERVVLISNSQLRQSTVSQLESADLIHDFIQRENTGYDFAAWRSGMNLIGFDQLSQYDSVTVMNDTCFGPLWDMVGYYERYEQDDQVDFWGITNHAKVKSHHLDIPEHLQSYFMSFKKKMTSSPAFLEFWKSVESYTDVQLVIDKYETQYTRLMTRAGFKYTAVLDTVPIHENYFHRNFTIHYPNVLLDYKVPFIKIKTFDLTRHLAPYLLKDIEKRTNYPIDLITSHMTKVSLPTPAYLLDRKLLVKQETAVQSDKKIAVHLHTYYVDLLPIFLEAFKQFSFNYDLYLTTDTESKKAEIEAILSNFHQVGQVVLTGNKGRDVVPMLKLKDTLSSYDYIGHFHTKKSPEYPYWVGDSWRDELFTMMFEAGDTIIAELDKREELGLVIADIPSFFRYTKIVDPVNENRFATGMNDLWSQMNLDRQIDFDKLSTFIMSYGTFIWFKYDALKPLFDLGLTDADIPAEPLPQHTILHSIERILVYLAWARGYDYRISHNPILITPFVDNTVINVRPELLPNTYIDFDHIGGIKGALKYIYRGPGSAIKYIIKRLLQRFQ